jgi:hypothetical protein
MTARSRFYAGGMKPDRHGELIAQRHFDFLIPVQRWMLPKLLIAVNFRSVARFRSSKPIK